MVSGREYGTAMSKGSGGINDPITKEIKVRLQKYLAMLRDIDNQIERLDRMSLAITSPQASSFSNMSSGSGTPTDRMGMMVVRKMELEEKIKKAITEEREENSALESIIEILEKPDERAVIRMRYFDRADWDEITDALFGECVDYMDKLDIYLKRTFKLHGSALLSLALAYMAAGSKRE